MNDISLLIARRTQLLRLSAPYQGMIEAFKSSSDDVVMITPPKCGSHNGWLAQVLHQIRTGGDEDFDDLLAQVPQLHCLVLMSGYPIHCAQNGLPKLFRSHEAIPLRLDNGNCGKVIFISGEPLDTFYCWQKYMEQQTGAYDVPQKDFFEHFDSTLHTEAVKLADDYWAQICYAWEQFNGKNPRFLWLHFRDLVEDLGACIPKIAAFMGVSSSDELIDRVTHFTSEDYITRNSAKFNFGNLRNKRLRLIGVNPHKLCPPKGPTLEGLKIGAGAALVDDAVKPLLQKKWDDVVKPKTGFETYDELYSVTSVLKQS